MLASIRLQGTGREVIIDRVVDLSGNGFAHSPTSRPALEPLDFVANVAEYPALGLEHGRDVHPQHRGLCGVSRCFLFSVVQVSTGQKRTRDQSHAPRPAGDARTVVILRQEDGNGESRGAPRSITEPTLTRTATDRRSWP